MGRGRRRDDIFETKLEEHDMSENQPEGLYVAAITPFKEDGTVDDDATRAMIERNLSEGAAGFFVAGSSGECFMLTEAERIHLFEVFSEYRDRCTMFAHVGSCGTEESVRYAKAARELGFQRFAATPPIYYGYPAKAVAGYYDDIAAAAGQGVFFYNIPSNTHYDIDLSNPEIRSMLASGSIAGVKHTNLDVYQMERLRSVNPALKCFGGFENEMVAFLAMGCDGFIGSTFNFMLPHYLKIYQAYLAGDGQEARRLQAKANNILETLMSVGLFPAIKHVLNEDGMGVGGMRRPFQPLSEDSAALVDKVVAENRVS
jgi:N-acetylneuraminate lyase